MSTVAIAGGHGKIALLLGALLAARGDTARGLIRNPDQEGDLRAAGIEPVICDLEGDGDVAAAVRGADAVVFAAGAGPGSGDARKKTMDFEGAVKLIDAAKAEGISRYLIVSAMGAGDPPSGDDAAEGFGAYLRAKADADDAVRASGLDFTIVRPGGLTDDPGTGLVAVAEHLDRGQIPRADVAAVFVACLDTPSTIGKSFDLITGTTPIADAIRP
jgi:nucleoside-diphosphate-sugar epimerase